MTNWLRAEESELLLALKRDEVAAFDELYRRHWKSVYELAYRKLQSPEMAEEIVQELFTSLWTRRKSLSVQSSLKGYLLHAVRNQVISQIRNHLVRRSYLAQHALPEPVNQVEQGFTAQELQRAFADAMKQLPEKTVEVFRLSREEYLTQEQISHHLSLSQKTVEYHISKALKLLRLQLRDFIAILAVLFLP